MYSNTDWSGTQKKFTQWWNNEITGAPMMRIVARADEPSEALESETAFSTPDQVHMDVEELSLRYRNYCRTHKFYAQAFPNLPLNLAAGSMALYLGCEPNFAWDTLWFKEWPEERWENLESIRYDPDSYWLKTHLQMLTRARELAAGRYWVNLPDIVENLDILSAIRGPQNLCYDLLDSPQRIARLVDDIDDIYFLYYDQFYDLLKAEDGSSTFSSFEIWGPGRTAKNQCDFSALIGPEEFSRLVRHSLEKQCAGVDNMLYHLDGPDAIRHVDVLMEVEGIDAINWQYGAGQPDALWDGWYEPVYDKVTKAGKALWLEIADGTLDDWLYGVGKLVDRYGTQGLYLLFPQVSEEEAKVLLDAADTIWKR